MDFLTARGMIQGGILVPALFIIQSLTPLCQHYHAIPMVIVDVCIFNKELHPKYESYNTILSMGFISCYIQPEQMSVFNILFVGGITLDI